MLANIVVLLWFLKKQIGLKIGALLAAMERIVGRIQPNSIDN